MISYTHSLVHAFISTHAHLVHTLISAHTHLVLTRPPRFFPTCHTHNPRFRCCPHKRTLVFFQRRSSKRTVAAMANRLLRRFRRTAWHGWRSSRLSCRRARSDRSKIKGDSPPTPLPHSPTMPLRRSSGALKLRRVFLLIQASSMKNING